MQVTEVTRPRLQQQTPVRQERVVHVVQQTVASVDFMVVKATPDNVRVGTWTQKFW